MMGQLALAAILIFGAIAIFFVFDFGSSDSPDLEIIETGIQQVEIPFQFCDGVLRNIDDEWVCEKAKPEFEIFDAGRGISCIEITRLDQTIDWECVQ